MRERSGRAVRHRRLRTVWLAAVMGAVVGALSGVYLRIVRVLTELLWDGPEARLPIEPHAAVVVTTVLGGVVVGIVRMRHDRDQPHDLDDALLDLDEVMTEDEPTPPPSVTWLLRTGVLGIVSLMAGASLGPEAPLLVLATGFGRRMARILRTSQQEAAYISSAGALSAFLGGPLGAVVLPTEGSRSPERSTRLIGPGIIAGVSGLAALLLVLPTEGSIRYVVPDVDVGVASALGWAVLGGVLATAAGLAMLFLIEPARHWAERLLPSTVPRAVVGGLVLGGCGALVPLTLFSGEHEGQDLIDDAATYAVGGILALVALKILATVACLATGWFGGQIFPGAFVGMSAALLPLTLHPSAPTAVLVAAGAGAGTTVLLRRPLAAALILLFFFPLTVATSLVVGAGVAALVMHALGDRVPQAAERLGAAH